MPKRGLTPIIIVLIIALLVLGVISGYWYFKNKSSKLNTVATMTTIEELTATTTTITNPKVTITTAEPKTTTTINQQKSKIFKCGDSVIFTYKGSTVTYGTVKNTTTNKCWMDRNLGASQVATAFNDTNAYGDLFQWGRLDDGHQTRTSGTTTDLSSSDNPGHINFITNSTSPYDWRSPQNDGLWQGVSGINNPCPNGWRLPTLDEWNNERMSWTQQNYNGAYASPLKLTVAGYRNYDDASLNTVGSSGAYWSNTGGGAVAAGLVFVSSIAVLDGGGRASGFSVRCLKD